MRIRKATGKAPPRGWRSLLTAPRAIGLAAAVIAILSLLLASSLSAYILLAAAAALILAPSGHAGAVLDVFAASFRRWPVIITAAFYDSLYWLVLILSGTAFGGILKSVIAGLRGVDAGAQGLAALQVVEANTATIRGVYAGIIGSTITWLALAFLAYVASRWLIWQAIRSARSPFPRWLAGNALWWLIWLVPVVLFVVGVQPAYAGLGVSLVFILYVHLGAGFHRTLIKESSRAAVGTAFGLGFGSIHRYIVPYAFAVLVYLILFQPLRLLPVAGRMQTAGFIIFVVLFLGWLRTYMDQAIERVISKPGVVRP
jgi:hypothetical protein